MSQDRNDEIAPWIGWALAWVSMLVGLVAVVVAANVYGEKTVLKTELRSCQISYAHVLKERGKAEARFRR
ncbi:MAG: hypothetical protein ACE5FK_03275 [Candidatus Methylomirabilia bacterium]